MTKKKIIFAALIIFIAACSRQVEQHGSNKNPEQLSVISFTITDSSANNDIIISEIYLDTVFNPETQKGIKVKFTTELNSAALQKVQSKGFKGIVFGGDLFSENKSYSTLTDLIKDTGRKILPNQGEFASGPMRKEITLFLPFRALKLEEGDHKGTLVIGAHPFSLKEVKDKTESQPLDSISSSKESWVKISFNIHTPKLYQIKMNVLKFKIDKSKTKVSKYDFSMGGPGLPDMFWGLKCGEEYLYHSQPKKNSTEISTITTSPLFYCSDSDKITITVADYDNGPFNTQHDVIGEWKGKIADLHLGGTDTLRFGNLEYFIVQTKLAQ